MKLLEPLKKFRQLVSDQRQEVTSVELWTSVWYRASIELRHEVATQIALSQAAAGEAVLIAIDDPMLIAELAAIYHGLVDIDGEPVTFRSVGRKVTLRVLPQALQELKRTPEVRQAMESHASLIAEQIAPELERVVRAAWSNHIKVRTRSRFIFEGFVSIPGAGTALNVLIIESSGHTSREILPVGEGTVKAVRTVTDSFLEFPSIILALGAKAEREIWVIPQIVAELQAPKFHRG